MIFKNKYDEEINKKINELQDSQNEMVDILSTVWKDLSDLKGSLNVNDPITIDPVLGAIEIDKEDLQTLRKRVENLESYVEIKFGDIEKYIKFRLSAFDSYLDKNKDNKGGKMDKNEHEGYKQREEKILSVSDIPKDVWEKRTKMKKNSTVNRAIAIPKVVELIKEGNNQKKIANSLKMSISKVAVCVREAKDMGLLPKGRVTSEAKNRGVKRVPPVKKSDPPLEVKPKVNNSNYDQFTLNRTHSGDFFDKIKDKISKALQDEMDEKVKNREGFKSGKES